MSSTICRLVVFFCFMSFLAAQAHPADRSFRANLVDCIVDTSKLLPKIRNEVISVQKLQRECPTCSNDEVVNGNMTRKLNGWEEGCRQLEKQCEKIDASVCMASVKIIDTTSNAQLSIEHYSPVCRPNSCPVGNSKFAEGLQQYADGNPGELFYFKPKTSSAVLNACETSKSCEFVFDICGTEARMPYDSSKLEAFENVLSSVSNAQDDAAHSDGSDLSVGLIAAIVAGGMLVVVIAAVLYKRRQKTPIDFTLYE